jgi:hypothetical protein
MSFGGGGGGYNGGRTSHATPVILNVYDLSPANEPLLNHIGFGIHHTGVEISGTEYSFAGGAGIFEDTPKEAGGAVFSHSVALGNFEGSSSDIKVAISDLRSDFGPDAYNILTRNCNHFANALSLRLLSTGVPGYVNRAANFGACFECLIPEHVLTGAPVGPDGSRAPPAPPSYSVMGGGGRAPNSSAGSMTNRTAAFGGSGYSLGGSGSSSSSRTGVGEEGESLLDKREKARQAAMARFDQSKSQ